MPCYYKDKYIAHKTTNVGEVCTNCKHNETANFNDLCSILRSIPIVVVACSAKILFSVYPSGHNLTTFVGVFVLSLRLSIRSTISVVNYARITKSATVPISTDPLSSPAQRVLPKSSWLRWRSFDYLDRLFHVLCLDGSHVFGISDSDRLIAARAETV